MRIKIIEEFIKLDSLLKFAGVASTGGHAKILILKGQIKVNGEVCLLRGKKIRKDDIVNFEDLEITVEN